MRRSRTRNAIDQIRQRAGLGDAPQALPGELLAAHAEPLPLVDEPAYRVDRVHPLPLLRGRPLYTDGLIVPADLGALEAQAQMRRALEGEIPKGAPADPIRVYPAWESRLENMRDFLAPLTRVFVENGTPGTFDLSSYQIAPGFTGFWKTFRFFFDPVPAALTPNNCRLTLLVDGDPVPDYYNLPLGPFMAAEQTTFVVAGSARRLSVRLQITQNVGLLSGTAWCLAYGNLRLATGLSPAREVGERVTPPAPAVVAPPAAPRAPARPSIVWHEAVIVGQGRQLVPLVVSGPGLVNRWRGYKGAARDLTVAELEQHREYLQATRPR